jgi:hypothetical protein
MNKLFTLAALALSMAAQVATASVNYGSVFPVDFSNGLPQGWAAISNNADAQTQIVADGLQITCNQTSAKYRTDIKYNMFGDYNNNADIWIDFDASQYKVFAIKFIGERPTSGVLKLSNISVSKTWIKGTDGYSLSEKGYTDIADADGNHTYYWTIGGDNWTGDISIDRIEIVIADITSDADRTFTVSSINWYKSVEDLEASMSVQQETAVVNKTSNKGFADLTSAWKAAADGDVLLVNENQEVSERLNSEGRSITVKGASQDITITRKARSNMMFLCNSKDCAITLDEITLDGNGEDTDKNFIEASASGQVVFNNVTIQNANSSNNLGLVVAKNSGKVALNGITFTNCSTNNNAVDVFIGANGSTIEGNNSANISIEVNDNAYAIEAIGALTNESAIKLTPYGATSFNADLALVNGTTDASKFELNSADQHLEADNDNNALVVKNGTTTAINSIISNSDDVTPIYYNLSGIRVANPTSGLYIVRRGSKVSKEYIR